MHCDICGQPVGSGVHTNDGANVCFDCMRQGAIRCQHCKRVFDLMTESWHDWWHKSGQHWCSRTCMEEGKITDKDLEAFM